MDKKIAEQKVVNYDIYNALNLMNENLGVAYLLSGFNPFETNKFLISDEYIIERYENSSARQEINAPEFMEHDEKNVKTAFEQSVNNLSLCLQEVEEKLSSLSTTAKDKEYYKKLKFYLKCRIELTNIFITNLKKTKNRFGLYEQLQKLNIHYSKYFDASYEQEMDVQVAINACLIFMKENEKQSSIENKKLIAKAKEILKQNQKEVESEKQAIEQKTVKKSPTLEKPQSAKQPVVKPKPKAKSQIENNSEIER